MRYISTCRDTKKNYVYIYIKYMKIHGMLTLRDKNWKKQKKKKNVWVKKNKKKMASKEIVDYNKNTLKVLFGVVWGWMWFYGLFSMMEAVFMLKHYFIDFSLIFGEKCVFQFFWLNHLYSWSVFNYFLNC